MALPKFKNEPYIDFTKKRNRQKMEKAITDLEKNLGKEYPNIIGGEKVYAEEKFQSINPGEKDQVVGIFQKSGEKEAERALDVAEKVFEEWKYVPAKKRTEYLFRGARIMRKRRYELIAAEVLEGGKTYPEADAQVAEAIDFLEYYGRQMLDLDKGAKLPRIPSEKNEMRYIPLGVCVVIPPWNFPMAILAGMTTAAVVAGNTVILKPSSDTPFIGYKFMEVMKEAKLPDGVINFLPGPGSKIGNPLVESLKTRLIAFTGSMEVGIDINQRAAKVQPGQIWLKRVIAEMGGKDTIVVDKQADIDAAVEGVVVSAFGYQGQKCSACSRVVVDQAIYDEFIDKLVDRTAQITIGPPKYYENWVGPVINQSAEATILGYIQKGLDEGGRLLFGGEKAPGNGFYIKPTIIDNVDPKATISQEEIFGPVLAVLKANDYDHALDIANNTIYGLTGSVYTKNRKKIEEAKKRFHVGNLYINRKCTGALVGVHPFGGFNMSGTDSKAGGPDYLLLFTQPKAWSEKIK